MARAAFGAVDAPATRDVAHASETLLDIDGLSHHYGEGKVLDGLSFRLMRGEIFGLLGPNGCGKSTTLRVLTGLLVPDACELKLLGQRVAPGGRELRRHMGVVFQSPSLDPRLSVLDNLRLTAALQRVPSSLVAQRVAQALEFSQLHERAGSLVKTLSGGMQRRLELARAVLHAPELLLLDEPTSGLDEASFRRTWQRILSLRDSARLSVLLTTHRAEEAALCDRVAVLAAGRLVALDTPKALIARVAGDVLTLEVIEPQVVVEQIAQQFRITAHVVGDQVRIEHERGHELVPRLVEALPPGTIRSLSMHRPTLSDVFVKLTGQSLDAVAGAVS